MEYKERVETTTTKTYNLTEEDIIDIIKAHLGLDGDCKVEFDVSGAGFLRGATVTSTYTVLSV